MRNIFILIVALSLSGCTDNTKFVENFNHYQSKLRIDDKQNGISPVKEIVLEKKTASYSGRVLYDDHFFYFVDKQTSRLNKFDKEGNFIKYVLGKGRSSHEVEGEIEGFTKLENNKYCILSSILCSVYDSTFNRINRKILHKDSDNQEIVATNPYIYTLAYQNFILKSHKNTIVYNMVLQHPDLNFITHTNKFFENARNIFITDYETGKVIKMIGKFPPMYKNGDHSQFSLTNFDVTENGEILLSYEADENIYCYDSEYNPTISFGLKGKDIYTEYDKLSTFQEFGQQYANDRMNNGYYKEIKHIQQKDYVARIYKKGAESKDGLQIYDSNRDLIADIDINSGSSIAGYDEKYLYTYSINEGNQEIIIEFIHL